MKASDHAEPKEEAPVQKTGGPSDARPKPFPDRPRTWINPKDYADYDKFVDAVMGEFKKQPRCRKDLEDKVNQKNALHEMLMDAGAMTELSRTDCVWAEFGVFQGETVSKMVKLRKSFSEKQGRVYRKDIFTTPLHGFDSFVGLPEFWRNKFESGAFSLGGKPPDLGVDVTPGEDVKWHIGWFNETTKPFVEQDVAEKSLDICFTHMDQDLFSYVVRINMLRERGTH